MKKEFVQWLKHGILYPKEFDPEAEDNKMTPFIEGEKTMKRGKPTSYDAFEKTFTKHFVYTKLIEDRIDPNTEEYFRIIERTNVVKLMSIIAEKALINKFDEKIGAYKIEERLRRCKNIPEMYVKAFRIFRPNEVWCKLLRDCIEVFLKTRGKLPDTYAEEGENILVQTR